MAEAGDLPGGASPLRGNRDFQLLWAGQAISVLGSRVSYIGYPLLVLAMTGSPASAGLVGFSGTIPYVIFQMPAGVVLDRVNRRTLMIVCDVCRTLALASIAAAIWLGRLTLVQVALVAFLEGTLFVFFRLGEVAAIRRLVAPEQYSQALGQNEARLRGANLLGQPLGGVLFGLGRGVPFLADAISYLASLISLLAIRAPFQEDASRQARLHPVAEMVEGWQWIWNQRFILITVSLSAAANALFQALILLIIVVQRSLGASSALIGLVLAGFGLGGLLGSLLASRIQTRLGPTPVVLVSVWTWALLTPPVGLVTNPFLLVPVLAGLSFVGSVWNVATNTVYFRLVPDSLIGRVSSVGSLVSFGALPFGSLIAGLLLQFLSATTATLLIAAPMLVLAVVATSSRSVRRGPEVPPKPGSAAIAPS